MKKLTVLALICAMTTAILTGCGNKTTDVSSNIDDKGESNIEAEANESEEVTDETTDDTTDEKTYKIGAIQLIEHAALDATNKGFVDALNASGIKYTIDQQNAQGDQSACQTIASKLVADENDLILAIATPAAQAVAAETTEIPILVTAVTDPADAGLVNSNEAPGTNVSGTSDLTPVTEQIDLLKKLIPAAKKVGILYCSAESNSAFQADMAKKACEAAGLEYEVFTVASSNEIQLVVESMVNKVDVVYAPTDNVIAAGMPTVAMVAGEHKLPVICGEEGMTKIGGIATYGIDYYKLGYMTGEQAVKILKGEADIAEMPIEYLAADQCTLTINEEVAASLGIDTSVIKE